MQRPPDTMVSRRKRDSSSETDETVFIRFCTAVKWHAAVILLRRTEQNLSHEPATAILVQIHPQAWNSVEHIWLKWDGGVKLLTAQIHHSHNSLIIIKKKKDEDWNSNSLNCLFRKCLPTKSYTSYTFMSFANSFQPLLFFFFWNSFRLERKAKLIWALKQLSLQNKWQRQNRNRFWHVH